MKTIALVLLSGFIFLNLQSQTNFQGGIYNSSVWTIDKSPYIITGDVVLFPDKTLTIQPGVEVRFAGNYFLEIRGFLVAIGQDSARIIFTSNSENPKKNDWKGIPIRNEQGAKASFEFCDFSFANNANSVQCCWHGGPVYFSNCKFDSNEYAMTGYNGNIVLVDSCEFTNNSYCITEADRYVTNSKFIGNEMGIFATERVNIRNSVFMDNNMALYGGRGLVDSCVIKNNIIGVRPMYEGFDLWSNVITDNNTGIQLSGSNGYFSSVKNNLISNNTIYNVENLDDTNKDLTGNFWGTSDSASIEDKLWDGYDNIYLGLFNYDIYSDDNLIKLQSVKKVTIISADNPEYSNFAVRTYPSPFSDELNIDINHTDIQDYMISVYNIFGQNVYCQSQSGTSIKLELERLNSGMYILVINSGSLQVKQKIFKK